MLRIAIMLMLLLGWRAADAQADEVLVRAEAQPTEPWVGQRVILTVDVLSAAGWAQVASVGEIVLPGAYVLPADGQGTRLQETIDGVGYTGQRYKRSVYPQRAGEIRVPPTPVAVGVQTWGADASRSTWETRTPAVVIRAKWPPGAEGLSDLISTKRFTAVQEWSPVGQPLRVGDALRRTVTREAQDVSGMALAPLRIPELPDVGLYPAEPRTEEDQNRGRLTGRRIETLTYVFEQAGTVSIPDIALTWWNLADERLESLTLRGRAVEILPAPEATRELAASMPGPLRGLSPWALSILPLAGVLLASLTPSLRRRWRAWNRARLESEASFFRRAVASIRSGDARRALRDIMRWLDRSDSGTAPVQLIAMVRDRGLEQGLAQVEDLQASAAEDSSLDDPKALVRLMTELRRRQPAIRRRAVSGCDLPELNRGCDT